ncbi:MAG: hypothetical protein DRP56_08825 [Planctomycetota bacterium]|nr:MAG: hypothetical protein DRP56_08825 [Planctomycetota bacterium]
MSNGVRSIVLCSVVTLILYLPGINTDKNALSMEGKASVPSFQQINRSLHLATLKCSLLFPMDQYYKCNKVVQGRLLEECRKLKEGRSGRQMRSNRLKGSCNYLSFFRFGNLYML